MHKSKRSILAFYLRDKYFCLIGIYLFSMRLGYFEFSPNYNNISAFLHFFIFI